MNNHNTRRFNHIQRCLLGSSIALLLAMAMFCERVQADIVGQAVEQNMKAQASFNFQSYSNISLPPASAFISAFRTSDRPPFFSFYAEASQTIHTYVGPMSGGDITPYLSLSAATRAQSDDPTFSGQASAFSAFNFQFALDTAHAYTFNFSSSSGLGFAFVQLIGPDAAGVVASGSGMLPAGNYFLQASSQPGPSGEASTSFSLDISANAVAVPEAPAWMMLSVVSIGLVGYTLWKKFRRAPAATGTASAL